MLFSTFCYMPWWRIKLSHRQCRLNTCECAKTRLFRITSRLVVILIYTQLGTNLHYKTRGNGADDCLLSPNCAWIPLKVLIPRTLHKHANVQFSSDVAASQRKMGEKQKNMEVFFSLGRSGSFQRRLAPAIWFCPIVKCMSTLLHTLQMWKSVFEQRTTM